MKIENINITDSIKAAKKQVDEDTSLSPSMRKTIELLILIINLLVNKIGLNSTNSSIPPSQDPNRDKDKKKRRTRKDKGKKRKPVTQKGHDGSTLTSSHPRSDWLN